MSVESELCWLPNGPDVGILRFFLLFVFSNESYPSTESPDEAADCGIDGLIYLTVSLFEKA